jgi:hypothetical protein
MRGRFLALYLHKREPLREESVPHCAVLDSNDYVCDGNTLQLEGTGFLATVLPGYLGTVLLPCCPTQ